MNHANPHPETSTRHRGRAGPSAALLRATVIGLGGVGRQVALQLAAFGVPWLQLVDSRTVSRTRAAEGYARDDVGRPRIHAVAQRCHEINPQLEIHTRRRSLRDLDLGVAVFRCGELDHISVAQLAAAGRSVEFWGRCRIAGHAMRLDFRGAGKAGLRPSNVIRAHRKSGARRSVDVPLYMASVASGLLIAQFLRFTAGEPFPRTLQFDHERFTITLG